MNMRLICILVVGLLMMGVAGAYGSATLPSGAVIDGIGADTVTAEYYAGTTDFKDIYLVNGDRASNTVMQFYLDCGSVQDVASFVLTNHYITTLSNIYTFKIYVVDDENSSFDPSLAASYNMTNPVYEGIGETSDVIYSPTDRLAVLSSVQTKRYFMFEVIDTAWILSQPGNDPYTAANFYNLTPQGLPTLPSGVGIAGMAPDTVTFQYDSVTSEFKDIYLQNGDRTTNLVMQFYIDCGSAQDVASFTLTNMLEIATLNNIYEFNIYVPIDENSTSFNASLPASYDLANPVYNGIGETSDPIYFPTERTAVLNGVQTNRYFMFEVVSNCWEISQPGNDPYNVANFYDIAPAGLPTLPSGVGIAGMGADTVTFQYDSGSGEFKDIYLVNGDRASNLEMKFYIDCGAVENVGSFILTNMLEVATLNNIYEFKIYVADDENSGSFNPSLESSYDLANPVYYGIGTTTDWIYYPTDRVAMLDAVYSKRYFMFEVLSNCWAISQPGNDPYSVANFYNITPSEPYTFTLPSGLEIGGIGADTVTPEYYSGTTDFRDVWLINGDRTTTLDMNFYVDCGSVQAIESFVLTNHVITTLGNPYEFEIYVPLDETAPLFNPTVASSYDTANPIYSGIGDSQGEKLIRASAKRIAKLSSPQSYRYFMVSVKSNCWETSQPGTDPYSSANFHDFDALIGEVDAPTLTPDIKYMSADTLVNISCTTSGADIYYTTDGSEPGETNGTLYTSAITVSDGMELKVVAVKANLTNSPIVSRSYVIDAAMADLSRGHYLLIERGLQVQALAFPRLEDNHQEVGFDLTRFAESNFNTVNLASNANCDLYLGDPLSSPNWGRWSGLTVLNDGEKPYVDKMVSWQYRDEQDISDPAVQQEFSDWREETSNLYPDVIYYTDQAGLIPAATLADFMQATNPDMICYNGYYFTNYTVGGSVTVLYQHMQLYRELGLAGNDGTYAKPIPYSLYMQTCKFPREDIHIVSESEMWLSQFSAWAFGYKFINAFVYTDPYSIDMDGTVFFDGKGDSTPTSKFYEQVEINRQSLNLGEALVRLLSTDVRMIMGKHGTSGTPNDTPVGITTGVAGADDYLTGVTASNIGTLNDSQPGDVIIGFFTPLHESFDGDSYTDQAYFMVVNGLSDVVGIGSQTRQTITLTFDFGTSGITSLQRLNRDTGAVENVSLVSDGGSVYHLDLVLDGGVGDLFKYNTGAQFVGFAAPPLSGDANLDGSVDVGDLGILAANYGTTSGATWATGDFNGDGAVDVGDLGILAANYGSGSSSLADFDADYAKVFGDGDSEEVDETSNICGLLGLPLIAGLLLVGLTMVKLDD